MFPQFTVDINICFVFHELMEIRVFVLVFIVFFVDLIMVKGEIGMEIHSHFYATRIKTPINDNIVNTIRRWFLTHIFLCLGLKIIRG